ncbi:PepSY-associated TM helix domain-containing protein [Comamonas sp. w2-DMI]|uniref:PepSY-associated TM helix domain-containing protein n=1 Tax=Comamonas sp. w2-DMI TaxID=3126391 RepID=UPI0032E371CD
MHASLKRWLFLLHRWLGVALCLLFALWFVSGMVMMYVGYPKLTEAERLGRLPALHADAALLAPQEALRRAGVQQPLAQLRLNMGSAGRATYLATPLSPSAGARAAMAIDAATGQPLAATDAQAALATARHYAAAEPSYAGTVTEDAFTHSRNLDAHRPLHRVDLDDAAGTRLYVSGSTAQVVRDASRTERGWNYVGAWLHWLYPLRGGLWDRYWADTVNGLSLAGIALALSGTVVGIWRWRFATRYRSGRRTPYPGRMMRWHHVSGLLFAAVTLTWIFSGLMSMNPWKIFDSPQRAVDMKLWQPAGLALSNAAPPAQLLASPQLQGVRELRWSQAPDSGLQVVAYGAHGDRQVLDAATGQALSYGKEQLLTAAARLSKAPITGHQWLTDYDFHYYARADHSMTGGMGKPLPVLRVMYGDEARTWLHIDARTGLPLGQVDRRQRTQRWLFALLHSWDWLPLLERRPLWDGVLIALSLGGLLLSGTGVVVAWRRLRKKLRPHHRQGNAGLPVRH